MGDGHRTAPHADSSRRATVPCGGVVGVIDREQIKGLVSDVMFDVRIRWGVVDDET